MAGSWRGKKPLQRNAIIALANYRDKSAVPLLLRVMKEDIELIEELEKAIVVLEEKYREEANK